MSPWCSSNVLFAVLLFLSGPPSSVSDSDYPFRPYNICVARVLLIL